MTIAPDRRTAPVPAKATAVQTYDDARAVSSLDATSLHIVRRFSGGVAPGLAAQVRLAGGGLAWLAQQLEPALVLDAPGAAVNTWFPALAKTPKQLFNDHKSGVRALWTVGVDLSRWTMARRILSTRQVHEVMVDFWSNLLNVSLFHDALYWRVDYDKVIRAHALTSYRQLLTAAVTHPAMGLYLDNGTSAKASPNENLGRELLELHTVGVDGGYTEDDVKASARMLTGYRVDVWWPEFRAFYDRSWHDTEPVQVMGFEHLNVLPDGRDATTAYIAYLARHPVTARRLALRLCTRFVSDEPSAAIVDAVAEAYLANDTAIKPTLLAMVRHPGFLAGAGAKVRTPSEDYVATVRALGIRPTAPKTSQSFANAMYWHYRESGQPPYEWPTPDGYPETDGPWSGAGRLLASFTMHRSLAARWWPTDQALFPTRESFLPAVMPATLGAVVDNVSLRMLGQRPPAAIRAGVSELLGIPLTAVVTKETAASPWVMAAIQSCLLDSPLHLHR